MKQDVFCFLLYNNTYCMLNMFVTKKHGSTYTVPALNFPFHKDFSVSLFLTLILSVSRQSPFKAGVRLMEIKLCSVLPIKKRNLERTIARTWTDAYTRQNQFTGSGVTCEQRIELYHWFFNTVPSPISGHRWWKDICPLIRGVRFLESLTILVLFSFFFSLRYLYLE